MAGGSSSRKRSRRKREWKPKAYPATQLTDDLLVEILSRVPYRSLCRFRCVSTRWRWLISHHDYQKKLPQTLAGIFNKIPESRPDSPSESTPVRVRYRYCFSNVSGTGHPLIDPSFPFLPDRERERLYLVHSCNGLLLCQSFRYTEEDNFDYLVLNPATEEWVAVPVSWRLSDKVKMVRLGFDPAFSPHFYIFEFQFDEDDYVLGVKIYSSETGVWCHKQSGWKDSDWCHKQSDWKIVRYNIKLQDDVKSVFVNGVLYVIAYVREIGTVDVKGETWRIIPFPLVMDAPLLAGFIALSQGRLHLATKKSLPLADKDMVRGKLAIWVLEDKDSNEWNLKHTVCYKHLARKEYERWVDRFGFGFSEFPIVAIHPDRNMVFFVFGRDEKTLKSYDMDSRSMHAVCNLGDIDVDSGYPYIPLFSKSLPDVAKL